MSDDLKERLRTRARTRRLASDRKSIQEGKPDRAADLMDDAAARIEALEAKHAAADAWEAEAQRQYERATRAEAQLARMREALALMEFAADKVMHELELRISTAPAEAVPVFDGIADLHDAIGHARAALTAADAEGEKT